MTDVNNTDDIIDSRDVIARIEELESERDTFIEEWLEANDREASDDSPWVEENPSESDELIALQDLAKEASDYAPDWLHGETLIRDDYFEEYAQQFADDIGAIDSNAGWPNNCIDWERAARELQQDYTQVDFDGTAYWIR